MQDQGGAPELDLIADLKANFEQAFDALLESLSGNNRVYPNIALNREKMSDLMDQMREALSQQDENVLEEWGPKMNRAFDLTIIATGFETADENETAATQALQELINGIYYPFKTIHTFQAELQILNLQKGKIDLEEQLKFVQIDEHLRILQRLGHFDENL